MHGYFWPRFKDDTSLSSSFVSEKEAPKSLLVAMTTLRGLLVVLGQGIFCLFVLRTLTCCHYSGPAFALMQLFSFLSTSLPSFVGASLMLVSHSWTPKRGCCYELKWAARLGCTSQRGTAFSPVHVLRAQALDLSLLEPWVM